MATATASTRTSRAASEDMTRPQAESGTTKLERVEAKVKKNAHAAGQDIARHLHEFEKTNTKHVARAKRHIKADVAKFRKATRKLGAKFREKH